MDVTVAAPQAGPFAAGLAAPIGARAAHGASWTIFFSVLSKAITLATQIVLAWLLVPEAFGLVALTLSITSFASLLGSTNLRNFLIQQPDSFASKAGQVFWLALVLNSAAALILMACTPLFALLSRQAQVVPLILLAAWSAPLQALSTVYAAALNRALRFRTMAMINFAAGAVQNGAAVWLAWLGFGAYALILPLILLAGFLAAAYRMAAGPVQLGRPDPRQWWDLFKPVRWLVVNALFVAAQTYGGNLVIGLAQDNPAVTGFYFWGSTIAAQAVYLLATNLQGVLFPVLSKLSAEPERQFRAMSQACQTLLLLVVPVCALQYLLARPLIGWLFGARWLPAAPVVQWLSIGLVSQPFSLLAMSTFLARGRFRRLAGTTALLAALLMTGAALGACLGGQAAIAKGVGLGIFLGNSVAGWLVFREFGRGGREQWLTALPPLTWGVLSAWPAWWVMVQTSASGPLVQVVAASLVCLTLYALLIRLFHASALLRIIQTLRSGAVQSRGTT